MEESPYLRKEIKSINGIPQNIYKIPLQNIPEENLTGIDIPSLVEKIIIGPSNNPLDIKQAFEVLLRDAGVENPSEKIVFSNIPLRT